MKAERKNEEPTKVEKTERRISTPFLLPLCCPCCGVFGEQHELDYLLIED